MSAGVADILCITQITFIIVHNALLDNYGWFWIAHLEVFTYFATLEHRLKSVIDFVALQPVFKSRKICEDLKMCEPSYMFSRTHPSSVTVIQKTCYRAGKHVTSGNWGKTCYW